jgi:hypothetical protein
MQKSINPVILDLILSVQIRIHLWSIIPTASILAQLAMVQQIVARMSNLKFVRNESSMSQVIVW